MNSIKAYTNILINVILQLCQRQNISLTYSPVDLANKGNKSISAIFISEWRAPFHLTLPSTYLCAD